MTTSDQIVREGSFPISGPHKIGPVAVFRGAWAPRILGMIAVFPFFSFPVQLALFFTVGWPYVLLEAAIVLILPVPVIAWLIAASTQTSTAFVWRSYFGVPVFCREPWRKSDISDLPAIAMQRLGDTQKHVPLIDALHDEITDPNRNPNAVEGFEFNPYAYEPDGADDELVSMMLRTEAGSTLYSVRQKSDRFHNLKVTGMLVILGVIPFITWLVLSSMTKDVAS